MVFQVQGEILSIKEGSFKDSSGKNIPFYQALFLADDEEVYTISVPVKRVEELSTNVRKKSTFNLEIISNFGKLRLRFA